MPTKPGGGNLPQEYDTDNGQYTDEDKAAMNKADVRALNQLRSSHTITIGYEPHFPTKGIHDEEYGKMFVELYKDHFHSPDISKTKPDYLFTYDASKDKSKWLDRQGFRSSDGDRLIKHILEWTNFTNVKYVDINSYNKLKVKALTAFENGVATTIWVVNKDYTLTFVTLIPGRSTYDK